MKSANSGLDISLACRLRTVGEAARAGDRSRAEEVMGVRLGRSLEGNLFIEYLIKVVSLNRTIIFKLSFAKIDTSLVSPAGYRPRVWHDDDAMTYLGVCGGENSPYTVSSSSVMLVYSCMAIRKEERGARPDCALTGTPVAPPVASHPDWWPSRMPYHVDFIKPTYLPDAAIKGTVSRCFRQMQQVFSHSGKGLHRKS